MNVRYESIILHAWKVPKNYLLMSSVYLKLVAPFQIAFNSEILNVGAQ